MKDSANPPSDGGEDIQNYVLDVGLTMISYSVSLWSAGYSLGIY